jgi:hypothetical protein
MSESNWQLLTTIQNIPGYAWIWFSELLTLWLDPWQIQLRCSPLWDFGLRTLFDTWLQLRNWTDFQLIAEGSTNACAIGFPFFTCHAFVNQVCSRRYASSQLALWTCGGVTPYTARNWLRSDEGSIKKFAARRCHLRIQEPKCKFVYSWREHIFALSRCAVPLQTTLNPYSWHAIEMTFDHISCDPVADRDHSAIQGASIWFMFHLLILCSILFIS